MGVEWYRDLSITILGFVTTAVLIFIAILVYRLYRTTKATLFLIRAASKGVLETVTMVQEGIKPLLMIMAVVQGIRGGLECFFKKFRKESSEGEENGE